MGRISIFFVFLGIAFLVVGAKAWLEVDVKLTQQLFGFCLLVSVILGIVHAVSAPVTRRSRAQAAAGRFRQKTGRKRTHKL